MLASHVSDREEEISSHFGIPSGMPNSSRGYVSGRCHHAFGGGGFVENVDSNLSMLEAAIVIRGLAQWQCKVTDYYYQK